MKDLNGKVAVVTGAASGIGNALSRAFAAEGMKVVLADVEADALERAAKELDAVGVVTDVSDPEAVDNLARRALDAHGAVNVVCNNAGVAVPGTLWETPLADWRWTMDVNLWGVVHGVRTFVPIMLGQDDECHVVNTASSAGLNRPTGRLSVYSVTKHAVVALSEALDAELREASGGRIKVSVLCPLFVNTRITEAERNRPGGDGTLQAPTAADERFWGFMRGAIGRGTPPEEVADCVVRAVKEEKLYVLPHPQVRDTVRERAERITGENSISM